MSSNSTRGPAGSWCFRLWQRRSTPLSNPSSSLWIRKGREVAGTWSSISREVVLDAKIMADGNYTLRISDYQMRGGQGFYYRVNAGELPYIKQVVSPGYCEREDVGSENRRGQSGG